MLKRYVGCGSSQAPAQILQLATKLAGVLSDKGLVLRASEQPGMDAAFCKGSKGKFFTYLPDEDFSCQSVWGVPSDIRPGSAAVAIARKLNPGFLMLPELERRWEIVANSLLVGLSGTDLAKILICWTPDGATKPAEFTDQTGHTARYIRLAAALNIPVINLARRSHRDRIKPWLTSRAETASS